MRVSNWIPKRFSSAESVTISAPETRLMAVPFLLMRPVRPTRCRYTAGSSGSVTSPASGVVADILVEVGQEVQADQQLAVVEAMKVMTPIESPLSGRVREMSLAVKVGCTPEIRSRLP